MTEEYLNNTEINKTVAIYAPASKVWDALTNPELIKRWMTDDEVDVITDWKVGSPIVFRGSLHWIDFENRGTILQFEPEKVFQYNYLSSLSNLPDITENYTSIKFMLSSIEGTTTLLLTLSDFPDEVIRKHLDFYWNVTLGILKNLCEQLIKKP